MFTKLKELKEYTHTPEQEEINIKILNKARVKLEKALFGSLYDIHRRTGHTVYCDGSDSTIKIISCIITLLKHEHLGNESKTLGAVDIEKAHKNIFPKKY